jgi:Protein of unknown function (DUF1592)/Protein of unknown function (DUF1588)/Protein of unknown function (DUF1595)/Protein of unknown function (DUF1587)/Protein of unknown function (DUF1585)
MKSVKLSSRGMLLAAAGILAVSIGAANFAPAPLRANQMGTETAASTVRRLTEPQYRNAIADIFGTDIKVVGRFEPDTRVEGLLAVGSSAVSVTPGGLEQYEEIARGIAAQVTDKDHRDKLVGCAPSAADAEGARCAEGFIKKVGVQLYRRPLAAQDVRDLTALTLSAAKQLGGFHEGLATALTAMLTSPHFLFRIDVPGSGGQVDGYSKASRLSFLFWNSTPDQALLAAAANGTLDRPDGLSREVDRLIASPRFVEGVRAFFSDFLQLDTIDQLSKDALIYPAFSSAMAAATREQTLRTITDLLVTHDGDYRELFTTRRFAMNRSLGPIYDIPVSKSGWYIHEFPEGDPRAGLLTQASLLALHSHPGRTSPTLRGKAIQEALLCTKVPAPPANVNFAVVQDVNNATLKTTRARLQAHLDDEECASCHRVTDPIGLGLEQFDGAGQFRMVEHDTPIDVTGEFAEKPFDGAAALGKLFHDNPKVSACLVSTAWRYANGRDVVGEAAQSQVAALTKDFDADGYRFGTLLRKIALDPQFYGWGGPLRAPSQKTARVGAREEKTSS